MLADMPALATQSSRSSAGMFSVIPQKTSGLARIRSVFCGVSGVPKAWRANMLSRPTYIAVPSLPMLALMRSQSMLVAAVPMAL